MSKNKVILCLVLFCLVLIDSSFIYAESFGSLRGTVIDGESGKPIIGGSVAIVGTTKGAMTNFDGIFLVKKMPIDSYQVKVTSIGYISEIYKVEIIEDSTSDLSVELFRLGYSYLRPKRPNKPNQNNYIEVPKYRQGSIVVDSSTITYSHASNKLGFNIFSEILKEDNSNNVFISPTSIMLALSMTYNGADKTTKLEMQDVLQLSDLSVDESNKGALRLQQLLNSADSNIELSIANSLWMRNDINFKETFVDSVTKYFNSEIKPITSAKEINEWVSDATNDKITKIVDEIDSQTILYLINAIYFKGIWTYQFNEAYTSEREFYLQDGKTKKHPLMEQTGDFKYFESSKLQAISLPYSSERLSMIVMLPSKELGIDNYMKDFSNENWQDMIHDLRLQKGTIALPKFKMEYDINLNQTLKNLGMLLAFDPTKADFLKMAKIDDDDNIYIQKVIHKTFLEVNEEGTEAAAITSVSMGTTEISVDISKPFQMIVDHPFFCAIYDNATQNILFMGVITNPE